MQVNEENENEKQKVAISSLNDIITSNTEINPNKVNYNQSSTTETYEPAGQTKYSYTTTTRKVGNNFSNSPIVEEGHIPEETTEVKTYKREGAENTTETTIYEKRVTTKTTTTQNNTPVYVQPTTRVYKHERVETKPMKYHVNQVITYIDTIKVNSDESEEVISTKQKSSTIDYSTYSATTNDLKAEATALVSSYYSEYQEMLGYVNQLRATEGASPLVLDYNLNVAATVRSLELGWSRQFSHTRPNGTQCFTVLDELGINYMAAGENIYY